MEEEITNIEIIARNINIESYGEGLIKAEINILNDSLKDLLENIPMTDILDFIQDRGYNTY